MFPSKYKYVDVLTRKILGSNWNLRGRLNHPLISVGKNNQNIAWHNLFYFSSLCLFWRMDIQSTGFNFSFEIFSITLHDFFMYWFHSSNIHIHCHGKNFLVLLILKNQPKGRFLKKESPLLLWLTFTNLSGICKIGCTIWSFCLFCHFAY